MFKDRKNNLLIAIAVTLIAVGGVALHAITSATPSGASRAATNAETTTVAACSVSVDPPACLVATMFASGERRELHFDFIRAGATSLIEANSADLVAAARAFRFPAPVPSGNEGRAQLRAASDSVILAAIALAVAAQNDDDPFSDPVAKQYIAAAGGTREIAQVATILWDDANFGAWEDELVRPRGLKAIWQAVAASPPEEPALLNDIAARALRWGYPDEASALARAVLQGNDPPPADPLNLDPVRAERWRSSAPQIIANEILTECMTEIANRRYDRRLCKSHYDVLRAAGGREMLRTIGDALLERAREYSERADFKPSLYQEASDAYLAAGDLRAAASAAREGQPFVEPAVRSHWYGRTPPPMTSRLEKQRAAALTGSFNTAYATAPVVALYRAGGREEALEFGFLSGYQRYVNAPMAGEVPDPQWVVDDRALQSVDQMIAALIKKPNAAEAQRFYDALRCADRSPYERTEFPLLERQLALLAALSGARRSMSEHFAAAAIQIDAMSRDTTLIERMVQKLPPSLSGETWSGRTILYGNVSALSQDWRRGLTIADRVAAKDETRTPVPCARATPPATP